MTIIQTHELSRHFGTKKAVDGLTFKVEAGDVFGFLGPNGAGKSTTIKMLTGQLRPTSGSAQVAGCDIVSEREAMKPQIGVVFEMQNIYERFSARENLRFIARLYGLSNERVETVLEQVGLLSRSRESVQKFSNGLKQRLIIGRALLHQPRMLFMDEPTRGLDPHIAREIRSLIADLAKQGMTVFLTTHYMEEADQLCQNVAIINQGHIVELDTPQGLKAKYNANTLEDVFIEATGHELRSLS